MHRVKDLNVIGKFELGKPYRPLEQLMFVLPAGSGGLLPKELSKLMTDVDSPIIEYYPIDFELDVMKGQKHIYSEPILPLIDDAHLLGVIRPIIDKLGAGAKGNNKLLMKPDYFGFPKKMENGKSNGTVKSKGKSKGKSREKSKENSKENSKVKTKAKTKVKTKAKTMKIKIKKIS